LLGKLTEETVSYSRTYSVSREGGTDYDGYRRTDYSGITSKGATSTGGTLKQKLPNDVSQSICVLSVDFDGFLVSPIEDYFPNGSSLKFASVVTRLCVKPGSLNAYEQLNKQKNVAANLKTFLEANKDDCNRIAVISAESLRICHEEISYRVTWERSIADTVRVIKRAISLSVCDSAPALPLLGQCEWIVVTFSNDAALIVNVESLRRHTGDDVACTEDTKANGSPNRDDSVCHFVSFPHGIEHDFRNGFTGRTRGTETLVTTSIALTLARSSDPSQKTGNIFVSELSQAVTLGLKASRHLQAHAWVTVEEAFSEVAKGTLIANPKEDLERVLAKLQDNWGPRHPSVTGANGGSTSSDSTIYLWNRLQSARFIVRYQAQFFGTKYSALKARVITWPYGDLAEILYDGFPTYGSFPPTAFSLQEGRSLIYKQTNNVANAWMRAGWLSLSQIPLSKIFVRSTNQPVSDPNQPESGCKYTFPPSEHDRNWWSLLEVALENMAAFIDASLTKYHVQRQPNVRDIKRLVKDEFFHSLAVLGWNELNARSESSQYSWLRFDIRLIYRVLKKIQAEVTDEPFYCEKIGAILNELNDNYLLQVTLIDDQKNIINDFFSKNNEIEFTKYVGSIIAPSSTPKRLLHTIPELQIGDLYSIDRRDIQSFREIRERLINYQTGDLKRPLNIGVFGSPGNGKSFAVQQILREVYKGIKEVEFLEYNLAQFSQPSDLTDAFRQIQNVALSGRMPVAFWDEFDTQRDNMPLGWLSYFLGPMQDGKFFVDRSLRTLPQCIFIFAGSMFPSFGAMSILDRAARHRGIKVVCTDKVPACEKTLNVEPDGKVGRFSCDDWLKAKGSDFASRLTGVLDISGISPSSSIKILKATVNEEGVSPENFEGLMYPALPSDEEGYLVRRALAIRYICAKHARWLFDENNQLAIADSVVEAILQKGEDYEHGMRSLESIFLMSSLHGRVKIDKSVVPTSSQLRIHAGQGLFKSSYNDD
jgi:hypothetical protein